MVLHYRLRNDMTFKRLPREIKLFKLCSMTAASRNKKQDESWFNYKRVGLWAHIQCKLSFIGFASSFRVFSQKFTSQSFHIRKATKRWIVNAISSLLMLQFDFFPLVCFNVFNYHCERFFSRSIALNLLAANSHFVFTCLNSTALFARRKSRKGRQLYTSCVTSSPATLRSRMNFLLEFAQSREMSFSHPKLIWKAASTHNGRFRGN